MSDTLERVIDCVKNQSGQMDGWTADSALRTSGSLDSLDMVELLMLIEDEFGVEIPDEDMDSLNTINDITNYVDSRSQS